MLPISILLGPGLTAPQSVLGQGHAPHWASMPRSPPALDTCALSHHLGLRRGNPALPSAVTQPGSASSGEPHHPSEAARAGAPAAAEHRRQMVRPLCFRRARPLCVVVGGVLPVAHKPPTQAPHISYLHCDRQILAPSYRRLGRAQESPRPLPPLHGNHGISPVRCLWQLQYHRKVRTGETWRERKGGSFSPAYTVGGPSQEDRTARVSTNRTRTQPGASGGRWVSPYTLVSLILVGGGAQP